jgi:TatA/E family protein of Tat protein translocase
VLNLDPAKLLIIAVVAVILLGPDKLPQVARQAGAAWRTFNEFRHRMETEVRSSIPDLPSSADIARLARSPSALLNHLSTLPAVGADNDGADKDGAVTNSASENGAANGVTADGVVVNSASAEAHVTAEATAGAVGATSSAESNGTAAHPPGAEYLREQSAMPTAATTPTVPKHPDPSLN